MRSTVFVIILILSFACGPKKTPPSDQTIHGEQLISANFLQYADSVAVDSLTEEVKSTFDIYDQRNNKIITVDAEELAEFQFNFFLPQLTNLLKKRKLKLELTIPDNNGTSRKVILNGETIELYTDKDLRGTQFWDIASRTFFRKLNEALKKQNARESFFLLYGGNDLQALFLTEEQFSIIADHYKKEPKERPYRP